MNCIIPLAGPDINNVKYGIKPLFMVGGESLVYKTLSSRMWFQAGELKTSDMVFIISRGNKYSEDLFEYLSDTFYNCKIIIIDGFTKGALLTASIGISCISNNADNPVIVDLVDIIFEGALCPSDLFLHERKISGIIPYFKSTDPKYSYLEINNYRVLRTVEKKVISDNASAGVYLFRNTEKFYRALYFSIKYFNNVSHNNLLYLCPSYNGLIDDGEIVLPVEVKNPISYSALFQ